jgi:hypothetical protein
VCLSLCVSPPLIFITRLDITLLSMCPCVSINFLVFYGLLVVSKKSRWLVLPRTSCLRYNMISHYCLSVCLPASVHVCVLLIFEAYEIALLSVCLCVPLYIW